MQYTAIVIATVLRVIDGDTITVNLPCNIDIICNNIPVRVEHIDTPELHADCDSEREKALEAKAVAENFLPPGSKITLANMKRDKYFRLLADVPKLSDYLIQNNLAKPYEGGTKSNWC